MSKEIFDAILNSDDGDYIFKALVLKGMKSDGW